MPLQIVNRICLKHDGKESVIPESLIIEQLGVKYIKIATASLPLIKAIYPERKIPHNASIAASSVIKRLVRERNVKCGLIVEEAALADQLFDGGHAAPPHKRRKASDDKLSKEPFVMSTDGIHIMTSKDPKKALYIKLETNDLETLFSALNDKEDEDQCLGGGNKRHYVKSGKYKGKAAEIDTREATDDEDSPSG
jgi:hypothetical protein